MKKKYLNPELNISYITQRCIIRCSNQSTDTVAVEEDANTDAVTVEENVDLDTDIDTVAVEEGNVETVSVEGNDDPEILIEDLFD